MVLRRRDEGSVKCSILVNEYSNDSRVCDRYCDINYTLLLSDKDLMLLPLKYSNTIHALMAFKAVIH